MAAKKGVRGKRTKKTAKPAKRKPKAKPKKTVKARAKVKGVGTKAVCPKVTIKVKKTGRTDGKAR